MANLKSAAKRINTNQKKYELNKAVKSAMRTHIKQVEKLIAANEVDEAKTKLNLTISKIDKAVSKGVIHRNNGNRQKSRLHQKFNSMSARSEERRVGKECRYQ